MWTLDLLFSFCSLVAPNYMSYLITNVHCLVDDVNCLQAGQPDVRL